VITGWIKIGEKKFPLFDWELSVPNPFVIRPMLPVDAKLSDMLKRDRSDWAAIAGIQVGSPGESMALVDPYSSQQIECVTPFKEHYQGVAIVRMARSIGLDLGTVWLTLYASPDGDLYRMEGL